MDVSMLQLPPGDPGLIDKIVCQLKSNGIFDQFRKECIADVDTKPAYQNLRQRVEGSVSSFLSTQEWRPDLNKNQLRDSLRKHIHESGFLDIGVERIVDQVVNPKMYTVFFPKVEDVVYGFLGLEKPKRNPDVASGVHFGIPRLGDPKLEKKFVSLKDLLPTDLDPISPEKLDSDEGDLDEVLERNELSPECKSAKESGLTPRVKEEGENVRGGRGDERKGGGEGDGGGVEEDEEEDEEDEEEASPPFESLDVDKPSSTIGPQAPMVTHAADMLDNITSSSSSSLSSEVKDTLMQYRGEARTEGEKKPASDVVGDGGRNEMEPRGGDNLRSERNGSMPKSSSSEGHKDGRSRKKGSEEEERSKKKQRGGEEGGSGSERRDKGREEEYKRGRGGDRRDSHRHRHHHHGSGSGGGSGGSSGGGGGSGKRPEGGSSSRSGRSESKDDWKKKKDHPGHSSSSLLKEKDKGSSNSGGGSKKASGGGGEKVPSASSSSAHHSGGHGSHHHSHRSGSSSSSHRHGDKEGKVEGGGKDKSGGSSSNKKKATDDHRYKRDKKGRDGHHRERSREGRGGGGSGDGGSSKQSGSTGTGGGGRSGASSSGGGAKGGEGSGGGGAAESMEDRRESGQHQEAPPVSEEERADDQSSTIPVEQAKEQVEAKEEMHVKEEEQRKEQVELKEQVPAKELVQEKEVVQAKELVQTKEPVQAKEQLQTKEHVPMKEQVQVKEQSQVKEQLLAKEHVTIKEQIQAKEHLQNKEQMHAKEHVLIKEKLQAKEQVKAKEQAKAKEQVKTNEQIKAKEQMKAKEQVKAKEQLQVKEQLQAPVTVHASPLPKLKKPKIAANVFEVKKIMEERKRLERKEMERRASEVAVTLKEAVPKSPVGPESELEDDVLFLDEQATANAMDFVSFVQSLSREAEAGDFSHVPLVGEPEEALRLLNDSDASPASLDFVELSDVEVSREDEEVLRRLGAQVERRNQGASDGGEVNAARCEPSSSASANPCAQEEEGGSGKRPRRPNPRYNSGEYSTYSDEERESLAMDQVSEEEEGGAEETVARRQQDARAEYRSSSLADCSNPVVVLTDIIPGMESAKKRRGGAVARRLGVRGPLRRVTTPDAFVMPLSPESDVSTASGDAGRKALLISKEVLVDSELMPEDYESESGNRPLLMATDSEGFHPSSAETDALRAEGVMLGSSRSEDGDQRRQDESPMSMGPRRIRGTRSSSRVQQRYSSDDLYKPRPNITLGRRNRGKNSPTQEDSESGGLVEGDAERASPCVPTASEEGTTSSVDALPNKKRRR